MKHWTIDPAKAGARRDEPARLIFNERIPPAIAGGAWCDDLIIRSPQQARGQAYLGPEAFDELVRLVEQDNRKMATVRLAIEHARDAMLAEGVPDRTVDRVISRMVLGVVTP